MDIRSGRIRYTRYVAFLQISKRIDESVLSRALLPEDLRKTQPDWRRTLTLAPGIHHSPHYIFHSAFSQIRELETIWRMGEFTPAARSLSARRLLEVWQQGQSDGAASSYLKAIAEIANRARDEKKSTDLKELTAVAQDAGQ